MEESGDKRVVLVLRVCGLVVICFFILVDSNSGQGHGE